MSESVGPREWPVRGMIAGAFLGTVLLAAAAVHLLSTEAVNAKVLVAVWLWALPTVGIGAGLGWLAGRVARRLLKAERRGS